MGLITIDEDLVREMLQKEIEKQVEKIASEKLFWTVKELEEYTNMCLQTMKEYFFYDEKFPKFKIGRTWRFPVSLVKGYLENWSEQKIKEQRFG